MSRIRFAHASDVYAAFDTAEQDIRAPAEEIPPLDFVTRLAAGHPEQAIAFLAYLLPRREAVWWACRCVRHLLPEPVPAEEARIAAAEDWVKEPSDARQRAALRIAVEGDKRQPGVWCAQAAGWSGGNVSLIEDRPMAAQPHLTPKAINAALMVGLGMTDPLKWAASARCCVDAGARFAAGGALTF
ncbi:hypothetical protein MWN34_03255 [Ancylobacter sp. 6x-1]|uniref:Secreted protein n=1 Tax=Ancylobacter crimeensis TaxID=2579147 RepID=A0ABT0D7K6_9HYPH|nr:hypothetical protein [Ancylobacter crimeensis]MCK0195922.1 hypothetical protein [Ancylobacter crimeensis]